MPLGDGHVSGTVAIGLNASQRTAQHRRHSGWGEFQSGGKPHRIPYCSNKHQPYSFQASLATKHGRKAASGRGDDFQLLNQWGARKWGTRDGEKVTRVASMHAYLVGDAQNVMLKL